MDRKEKLKVTHPSVFLSYAQADRESAEALEQGLRVRSVSAWRDKTSLHAGEKWPKALGEAIQRSSALILLWSAAASRSEFVELEWNIAVALKKPVLSVLSDETPLPVTLRATHGIKERELERIVQCVMMTLKVLESAPPQTAPGEGAIIGQLDSLPQRDPHEVLQSVKLLLEQPGWAVSGQVYQAGGDIIIHGRESEAKTLADHWKVWVGIVVGVLTAATLAKQFIFNAPTPEIIHTGAAPTPVQPAVPVSQHISGIATDESDTPIQGAKVVLMGSSDSTVTQQDGGFSLPVHGSNDLVRLNITKDGFHPLSEYYPVRREVRVMLRRQ